MAYSNYGAFVWKNGVNISKETCDKSNDYSGGHALLDFEEFSIEFYKLYEPIIRFPDSKKLIEVKSLDISSWYDKKLKLRIIGYRLDDNESINCFDIQHNGDNYCVICGAYVGMGYQNNHVSRYILKNMRYDNENGTYHIKTKFDAWLIDVIAKKQRLDEIDFERHSNWHFHIKPFLKQLLRFRFDEFYFKEIVESFYKIHLLK